MSNFQPLLKHFETVICEWAKEAQVFVPDGPFQPSLMFAGKAMSLPQWGAPERRLIQNILLLHKNKSNQNFGSLCLKSSIGLGSGFNIFLYYYNCRYLQVQFLCLFPVQPLQLKGTILKLGQITYPHLPPGGSTVPYKVFLYVCLENSNRC